MPPVMTEPTAVVPPTGARWQPFSLQGQSLCPLALEQSPITPRCEEGRPLLLGELLVLEPRLVLALAPQPAALPLQGLAQWQRLRQLLVSSRAMQSWRLPTKIGNLDSPEEAPESPDQERGSPLTPLGQG